MVTTLLDLLGSLLLVLAVSWALYEVLGMLPLSILVAGLLVLFLSMALVRKGGDRK